MQSNTLIQLRALARYKTHGGYVWAAVMNDGALVCTPCVRANYRQIFRSTRDQLRDGWCCEAITHSGEWDESEWCAHCNAQLSEVQP